MFFYLSKFFAFLFVPFNWIFIFLGIGILFRKRKLTGYFSLIGFILLYLFTNSFLLDEAMRTWEVKAVDYSELDSIYDYGIVLGGMSSYDAKYKRVNFSKEADRLFQVLPLYRQNRIKKILISGGSGFVFKPDYKESGWLKKYLIEIGISEKDIIIEKESKNTYENAINTAKLLKNEKEKKILLISSAIHLKRAKACFEKAGLSTTVFATDRNVGKRKFNLMHFFMPNVENLTKWNYLTHEVVGYYVYKIKNYI